MGQISSINFKKSIPINTEHNDRTLAPNYLIDKEKGAESVSYTHLDVYKRQGQNVTVTQNKQEH